ncbi:class I SAM-dependent methyltransferase [Tahibacter caeni]|uniref:class I SAM-dependent methyltransferase n=1 Tax=Tahibacter caeni TaxID=1453545 RepID=UPI0021495548|nr:class I SAM-dependent methyltransferase [Tahibacter caeni]
MERIEKILHRLRREGRGLEFGPSHSPVAPKSAGFRVETVDHLDRAGLIDKYRDHGVDLNRIEDVDHVWSGQPLTELIRNQGQYDWIIASHVIEHVPDLIGFVNQCAALLKPDGLLSLAVPDLRYSFDCLRWPSTAGEILQAHLDRRTRHAPGKVFDYFTTVVMRNGRIVWNDLDPAEYAPVHTFDQAELLLHEAIETTKYCDFHAWAFTPTSFRFALNDLRRLKLLELGEVEFFDTVSGEFHVTLGRAAPLQDFDRVRELRKIRGELAQVQVAAES